MKDNLEKFIAENRDQFDVFDPDDKLWKGIQSRVQKQKRTRIGTRGILWRAAAVVVIFMISFADVEGIAIRATSTSDSFEILGISVRPPAT